MDSFRNNRVDELYWYLYHNCSVFRKIRHFVLYVFRVHWYWYLVTIVISIGVFLVARKRLLKKHRMIALILLVAYVFLLYASLVLSRPIQNEYQYNTQLLWTLKAVIGGDHKYIQEILLNLFMLLPVGFLLPIVVNKRIQWVVGCGCLISLSIELLQLVTRTGLCEIDDLIYNTISVTIGYCIYKVGKLVLKALMRGKKKDII